ANPHNTQPWRFRRGAGGIDVFSDRTRNIGTIDPRLREMHIGIGCAIENLLLAARAAGWSPQLALFPNPADATQVARVGLVRGEASVSPLHAAIPLRHTNRGAYDTRRPLEPSVFAALDGLRADLPPLSVRWLSSAAERRSIG